MQISIKQLGEMRHALGLNYKSKPYRNYFYTDSTDKDWNDLVSKQLATNCMPNESGNCYFRLTKQAVEIVTGKSITDKKYEEL